MIAELLSHSTPYFLTLYERELANKAARAREEARTDHLLEHHHTTLADCPWCCQRMKLAGEM
jgi:hypothetical protein